MTGAGATSRAQRNARRARAATAAARKTTGGNIPDTTGFGTTNTPLFGQSQTTTPPPDPMEDQRLTTVYDPHNPPADDAITAEGVRMGVVADVDGRLGRHQSMRLGRYTTSWKNQTPFPAEMVDVDELYQGEKQWLDIEFRHKAVKRRVPLSTAPGRGCTGRYWASRPPIGRRRVLHGRVTRSTAAPRTSPVISDHPTQPSEAPKVQKAQGPDAPIGAEFVPLFGHEEPTGESMSPKRPGSYSPETTKKEYQSPKTAKKEDFVPAWNVVMGIGMSYSMERGATFSSLGSDIVGQLLDAIRTAVAESPRIQRVEDLPLETRMFMDGIVPTNRPDSTIMTTAAPPATEPVAPTGTTIPVPSVPGLEIPQIAVPISTEDQIMSILEEAGLILLEVPPEFLKVLHARINNLRATNRDFSDDFRQQMVSFVQDAVLDYDPSRSDKRRVEDRNLNNLITLAGVQPSEVSLDTLEHVNRVLRAGTSNRTLAAGVELNLTNFITARTKDNSARRVWVWNRMTGGTSNLALEDLGKNHGSTVKSFVRLPTDDEIARIRLEPGQEIRLGNLERLVDSVSNQVLFVPQTIADKYQQPEAAAPMETTPGYPKVEGKIGVSALTVDSWSGLAPADEPPAPLLSTKGNDDEGIIQELLNAAGVHRVAVHPRILDLIRSQLNSDIVLDYQAALKKLFPDLYPVSPDSDEHNPTPPKPATVDPRVTEAEVHCANIVTLLRGNSKYATSHEQEDLVWVYDENDDTLHRLPANRALVSTSGAQRVLPSRDQLRSIRVQPEWMFDAQLVYAPRWEVVSGSRVYVDNYSRHLYLNTMPNGDRTRDAAVDGAATRRGRQLPGVLASELSEIAEPIPPLVPRQSGLAWEMARKNGLQWVWMNADVRDSIALFPFQGRSSWKALEEDDCRDIQFHDSDEAKQDMVWYAMTHGPTQQRVFVPGERRTLYEDPVLPPLPEEVDAAEAAGPGRAWFHDEGAVFCGAETNENAFDRLTDRDVGRILVLEGDFVAGSSGGHIWREVQGPEGDDFDRLYIRSDRLKEWENKLGYTEMPKPSSVRSRTRFTLKTAAVLGTPRILSYIPAGKVGTSPEHMGATIEASNSIDKKAPDSTRMVKILKDEVPLSVPDNRLWEHIGAAVNQAADPPSRMILEPGERVLTACASNPVYLTPEQVRAGGGMVINTGLVPPVQPDRAEEPDTPEAPEEPKGSEVSHGIQRPRQPEDPVQRGGPEELQKPKAPEEPKEPEGLQGLKRPRQPEDAQSSEELPSPKRPTRPESPKPRDTQQQITPPPDTNRRTEFIPRSAEDDAECLEAYPDDGSFNAAENLSPAYVPFINGRPGMKNWDAPPQISREVRERERLRQHWMRQVQRAHDRGHAKGVAESRFTTAEVTVQTVGQPSPPLTRRSGARRESMPASVTSPVGTPLPTTVDLPSDIATPPSTSTAPATGTPETTGTGSSPWVGGGTPESALSTRARKVNVSGVKKSKQSPSAAARNVTFGPLPTEADLGRKSGSGLRTRSGVLYGAPRRGARR